MLPASCVVLLLRCTRLLLSHPEWLRASCQCGGLEPAHVIASSCRLRCMVAWMPRRSSFGCLHAQLTREWRMLPPSPCCSATNTLRRVLFLHRPVNSLPSPYCALFARNDAPPPPYNAILTSRASSFHHKCSTPYARDVALLCTLTRAPPSPEYSLSFWRPKQNAQKTWYTSQFVRVMLAQGPC